MSNTGWDWILDLYLCLKENKNKKELINIQYCEHKKELVINKNNGENRHLSIPFEIIEKYKNIKEKGEIK